MPISLAAPNISTVKIWTFSAMWVKAELTHCGARRKARDIRHSAHSLFPPLPSQWSCHLGAGLCWLGGGADVGRVISFSPISVRLILVPCSPGVLQLLSRDLDLPWNYVAPYMVVKWPFLCGGGEGELLGLSIVPSCWCLKSWVKYLKLYINISYNFI